LTARGVYIPGGKVEDLVDAGAEASFLGFNPSAEFQDYQTLSYSAMQLASQELTTGQIRTLMQKNSYTDQLAMTHIVFSKKRSVLGITIRTGINDTAAQYIIGKVFTTTASGDITSTSGKAISAKSGGEIPACKYLSTSDTPAPTSGEKKPSTTAGAAKPASATQTKSSTPNQSSSAASEKPQGTVAQLGQDAVQIVGDVTGKKVDATKTVKATTSTVASGGIHYCRKDSDTVHFEAEHPFPVAVYLYQLFVKDDKTWLPTHATVAFIPGQPTVAH